MTDPVAIILTLLYLVIFLSGAVQVKQILFTRRFKRATIRNCIISILTLSCLLRVIFWCKVASPTYASEQVISLIFFMPVWMNFFALSFLASFYGETLILGASDVRYSRYKDYPVRLCLAVNFVLFVLCLTLSLVISRNGASDQTKTDLAVAFSLYASLLDFVLAGLLGILGYAFYNNYAQRSATTRILPRSVRTFAAINYYIVCVYILRGMFTAAVGQEKIIPVSEGEIVYQGPHPATAVTVFFFYLIADWSTAACVIFLLWRRVLRHKRISKYVTSVGGWGSGEGAAVVDSSSDTESLLSTRLLSTDDDRKVSVFYGPTGEEDGEDADEYVRDYIFDETGNTLVDDVSSGAADSSNNSDSYDASSSSSLRALQEAAMHPPLDRSSGGATLMHAAIPIRIHTFNPPASGPSKSVYSHSVSPSAASSINTSRSQAASPQMFPAAPPSREPSPALSSSSSMSKSFIDRFTAPSLSAQPSKESFLFSGPIVTRGAALSVVIEEGDESAASPVRPLGSDG